MKSAIAFIVFALIIPVLLGLPAALAGSTPDALGRVAVQSPPPATAPAADEVLEEEIGFAYKPVRLNDDSHEIEMDVHVGRAAAPTRAPTGGIAYMPDEVPSGAASPECSVSALARLEGRRAARMSRSEQEDYVRWCEGAAGLDASATAQIQSSPVMDMVSAGGPSEILCPPSSTQCYCWNGKHYNGCQNFASHCTSGLTCGPGGKICHCDAN